MKRLWSGVVAVGAVALLGAATAALPAGGGPGGRGERRGPHGRGDERLAAALGLTDDQKATWQQMHQEFRESMRATFEQQRPNMEKLRAAVEAEQADPAAVGRLVLSMHQHRKEMQKRHEAFEQRLRGILTPEQQIKFDALQALRPRRGPGRGGFGPGPHGPGGPDGPDGPDGPEGPDGDVAPPPEPF